MTPQPAPNPSVGLPDEKFWQRYSPRSELPLSSVASVSLHLLILLLLLAGGIFLVRSQDNSKPLPGTAIEIANDQEGGQGTVPAEQPAFPKREDIGRAPSLTPDRPDAVKPADPLQPPAPSAKEPLPPLKDPSQEFIKDAREAEANLERIVGTILKDQNRPSGSREPRATGVGTKPGGDPVGRLNPEREARRDRWVLNIETRDGGNDYARQLHALGAILAIPQADGQYLIIRDLTKRPARGRIEDIAGIQRIFWVDDKPDSVRSLAAALQVDPVPRWIAAFFPEDLERDLLRKELAFKNRREADIRKTYFRLERKGTGYDPVVVAQEPREGVK